MAPVVDVAYHGALSGGRSSSWARDDVLIFFGDLRPASAEVEELGEIVLTLGSGERHLRPIVDALKAVAHQHGANAVMDIEGIELGEMKISGTIRARAVRVGWKEGG